MNKPQPSKGLGDSVAKVTKFIGIKPLKNCNCDKRKETLNKLFPYGKKGVS